MTQKKSFVDIINEYLVSEKTHLPAFNKTSMRIQQEINKKNPNIKAIEKMIICDQALTGQVLRMANSSFYRGLKKVSTIQNAIVRLGINEIANIATLIGHKKIFKSKDPFLNELMKKLWQHSVGCAIASQWLAKFSGFTSLSHEAFVAGLLHDVGKLFILTVIESIKLSGKIKFNPPKTLINEAMISLHTNQGYSLMKNWNIPENYCIVARDHHLEEFDSNNTLLIIVRLANQTCNKMGIGITEDSSTILATTTEADLLGLSEIKLAELEIKLEDTLPRLI
ncbi:HDOD domain-containing protein [Candidatus Magnetomoraceae bacterium gMMP-15]